MNPFRRTDPPFAASSWDSLAVAPKTTAVLAATDVDPGRPATRPEPGDRWEGEPPTTEAEILAAVRVIRDEIATREAGPSAVMDLVCRLAQFLTDAGGAVVEELERSELVYRAASGSAARSLGLRVDTQSSLSGLCFRTGEVMRCEDTEEDDRVDKAACRWVGIRSMVLVPVVRQGQSVGVLAVISPAVGSFGDRDVWTLRLLAEVLADALGNGPQRGQGP